MDKKRIILFSVIALVISLGLAAAVNAEDLVSSLSDIFEQLFGKEGFKGFSDFYTKYTVMVDFILFLIIFVSLGSKGVGERFPKIVGVVIGIVFAIGAAIAEQTLNFNLGKLGTIALFLVLGIIFLIIFGMVRKLLGKTIISNGAAFFISYGLVIVLFNTYASTDLFEELSRIPIVGIFVAPGMGMAALIIGVVMAIQQYRISPGRAAMLAGNADAKRNLKRTAERTKITKRIDEQEIRDVVKIEGDLKNIIRDVKDRPDIKKTKQIIKLIDDLGRRISILDRLEHKEHDMVSLGLSATDQGLTKLNTMERNAVKQLGAFLAQLESAIQSKKWNVATKWANYALRVSQYIIKENKFERLKLR